MTIQAKDIQDAANRKLINIKDYLRPAAREAYNHGTRTADHLRSAYPAIAESVSEAALHAIKQSQSALKSAGTQVATTAGDTFSIIGRRVYGLETSLLKISFIYAAYKLFASEAQVVAAAERVKARVHRKPVESAFIALGAGYLLGKIIRF